MIRLSLIIFIQLGKLPTNTKYSCKHHFDYLRNQCQTLIFDESTGNEEIFSIISFPAIR